MTGTENREILTYSWHTHKKSNLEKAIEADMETEWTQQQQQKNSNQIKKNLINKYYHKWNEFRTMCAFGFGDKK